PRRGALGAVCGASRRAAGALGAAGRGARPSGRLSRRALELAERGAPTGARPSVACIEWIEPPMAAGHWMPELVALAGGRAVLAASGAPSRWITLEELAAADPDWIVVLPCGFDLARTRPELPALSRAAAPRGARCARCARGAPSSPTVTG